MNKQPNINDKLINSRPSEREDASTLFARPSIREFGNPEFYRKDNWLELMCETLFKIKTRKTTIKAEIYYGFIHFISCMYCLAVIPQQLAGAGYGSRATVVSVAACAGIGSIICGIFSNLPFVIAPPTVVSIFLAVFLQQHGDGPALGNIAVIISGIVLILFGWRPLFYLAAELIPTPIQVGTAVGIGLMTALAGSTEIDLVVEGKYTILDIGKITPEIMVAISGVLIICIAMVYHVKGAFCLTVIFCSLVWWTYDNDWPSAVFAIPAADRAAAGGIKNSRLPLLTVDLVFLYVLYLNGLVTSLSNLALLTRENGKTPRARWIFIISGLMTIIGGVLSAPPMLISPESSASIKAGAKTGLSTIVCGLLFCLSVFLSPIFEAVPAAATSPVLVMIGVILFQNVSRIDWRNIVQAAPAFVVLFYIPFTYSVVQGVALGYVVYVIIAFSSGDLRTNALDLATLYFPSKKDLLDSWRAPEPLLDQHHHGPAAEEAARQTSVASVRSDTGDGVGGPSGLNLSMMFDSNTIGDPRDRQRSTTGMFDTTSGNLAAASRSGKHGSQQSPTDVEAALASGRSESSDSGRAPSTTHKWTGERNDHHSKHSQHNRGSSSSSVGAASTGAPGKAGSGELSPQL